MEYKTINIKNLKHFNIRDIRDDVVNRIDERIKSDGFNPAHPLSVVQNDDGYYVLDGNHRLKALDKHNIESVPCVVYPDDADTYKIAVRCNQDEDTYAPMDMFDWLGVIQKQKETGKTQQEIGESIGWSREKVKDMVKLECSVGADVLKIAKEHQTGRAPNNGAIAPFNFTEGWFRNSGLYDLEPEYQVKMFERFKEDKFNWNGRKVKEECTKYKTWQEFKEIAKNEIHNKDDIETINNMIDAGVFKTEDQLRNKISALNAKAKDKLIHGDCLEVLKTIEDNSIDLVITDPPYGMKYTSNRSIYVDSVTKNAIANDDENVLEIMEELLNILDTKTKIDSHYYIFTSWKQYPQFKNLIEKHLTIRNLIIWDKGNHGSGDLENTWGNSYECIIFATRGNRKINKRKRDIISINRPVNDKIHSTQKPEELIKKLLEVSSQPADVVLDPFMGSGSTIKAVMEYGGLNYIGVEIDKEMFDRASVYIGGDCDGHL